MPRRQCPYPECTWKTEDVDDISFATLSIQIHAQGAHPVTPPAPAPAPTADGTSSHSREEKVRRYHLVVPVKTGSTSWLGGRSTKLPTLLW